MLIVRRMVALAFALALTAAASIRPTTAQPAPYEINAILSLTGPAAFIGKSQQQSFDLIEGIVNKNGGINGRPVKFVVLDDGSTPAVSVQLANQLIAKNLPVFMGPSLSAPCLSVVPLVQANGPVEYCFSPAIFAPAGSYSYSSSASTKDDAVAIARYFRERGWLKVGLMATTDASGQLFSRFFDEALKLPENSALSIVDRESLAVTDMSADALAVKMKAADPQVVIAWAAGTATGTMFHALHDAGLDVPTLAGNGNMIHSQLAQYTSFIPKELYFPGRRAIVYDPSAPPPVRAAMQQFFAAYKSVDAKPSIAATLSWDPAMLIIDGLRKLGPNVTAPQLNDWIQHQSNWAGINGFYDFRNGNQRGLGIEAVVMDRWDPVAGDFVTVSKGGGALK
jgi:branched-chain amino acid transport system substrate-binding protein